MLYSCPRCDKVVSRIEKKGNVCTGCGLEFSISDQTDVSKIQTDLLIKRFADEITKSKKNIDYLETAINIIKASLVNVVMLRKTERCAFFRVEDMEISCYLFSLRKRRKCVEFVFDNNPKYKGCVPISEEQRKKWKWGIAGSYLETTSFETVADIAMAVYKTKTERYSDKKGKDKNSNLYKFR